ncbi:MAG: putative outer membrane protein [Calditrichaeota bacterium]|nr:putative outer membrane protein [Calditrichota bacterium]
MIERRRTIWIPVMLAVLLPAAVFAGGFNLAGVGAKGLAMSGAFRAIADDWSAMYWNPAGLAGQGSGIWLEGKVLYPISTLTPNSPSTVVGYDYYLYRNGVEQTSVESAHPTGSFALQYQLSPDLTIGVSAFTPSALGAEWNDLFIGPYVGYGENPEYPDKAWSSSLAVVDIHPTVGYKLSEKLSVGAGIAIKYTSIELRSPVITPAYDEEGDRLPLPGSHMFVDGLLEGTGVGFGFNVGLLYDISDRFHAGIAYAGPVTVPISGTVKQTAYLPGMAGAGTLEAEPDAEADFPLPMDLGVGFAYDLSDRWTIAADAVWTNWEALDKVTIKQDGTGPDGQPAEDSELILLWEDSYRFNAGVSWHAIPEQLELRAGWYYDPTPIPDETMRPTISDVADKQSLSIGFAYNLGAKFLVEGYYEHLFSSENDAQAFDNDGDGMYDNVPGAWMLNVDTFGLQIGYRF